RRPDRQEGLAPDSLRVRPAPEREGTLPSGAGRVIPLTIVIDLNPNIVRIGPLLITWHGVFAVLGIIAAARLGFWLLQKDVPNLTGTGDGLAWMVVLGLVGARLLYVWENFKLFADGQLLRIFAMTECGVRPRGCLLGGCAGADHLACVSA